MPANPVKFLEARLKGDGLRVKVHIDTTKTINGGQPDPAFIREAIFGKLTPSESNAAFVARVRREARELFKEEAQKITQAETVVNALENVEE